MKKQNPTARDTSLFHQLFPAKLSRGEQTKIAILRSTIASIAEEGVQNTNYESVGRRAGLQRAHVAYHFETREKMIAGALQFVFLDGQRRVAQAMAAANSPGKALDLYIEATFSWLESDKAYGPCLTLLSYLSNITPQYREMARDFKNTGTARVKESIKNLCPSDSQRIAERIHTWILGQCLYWLTCQPARSLKRMIKETQDGARAFLLQ